MQGNFKAENKVVDDKAWERVSVSSTCYLSIGAYISSLAPYLCSVTYYLVPTTLLTYTYLFH